MKSRWMLGRHWMPLDALSVLGTLKNIFLADTVGWWLVGWERFRGTVRDFSSKWRSRILTCPRSTALNYFHDVTHNLQNCWSRIRNLSRDSGWHWPQHFWRCHFFGGMTMGDPLSLTLAALGGWTEILSSLIMLILLGTCYVAARESMIPGWIGIQPPSLQTKIEELREHRKHGNYMHCSRPGNPFLGVSSVSLVQKRTRGRKWCTLALLPTWKILG